MGYYNPTFDLRDPRSDNMRSNVHPIQLPCRCISSNFRIQRNMKRLGPHVSGQIGTSSHRVWLAKWPRTTKLLALGSFKFSLCQSIESNSLKDWTITHRFEDKSVVFSDFDCVNQWRRSKSIRISSRAEQCVRLFPPFFSLLPSLRHQLPHSFLVVTESALFSLLLSHVLRKALNTVVERSHFTVRGAFMS